MMKNANGENGVIKRTELLELTVTVTAVLSCRPTEVRAGMEWVLVTGILNLR